MADFASYELALEQCCLKNSLILLETLQEWREASPQTRLENLILHNHPLLNEERWIEMLASLENSPCFYPATIQTPLCPLSLLPSSLALYREHFALFLQDDPILVVAVLNPFRFEAIQSHLSAHHPGSPYRLVSVTPHLFTVLAGLIELGTAEAGNSYEQESLESWALALNFEPTSFLNTRALVEDLWLHQPHYPVVIPHTQESASLLEEEPFVLVLRLSATNAWVASPKATNEALRDRLYQKLARRIHLLAIGPNELSRIRQKLSDRSGLENKGLSLQTESCLVNREWFIPSGHPHPEVLLLDQILEAAIRRRASDIHLEPKTGRTQVRFRVDGELVMQAPLPRSLTLALFRRAKILSGMRQDKVGMIQDGAGYHELEGVRTDMRYSITVCQGGEEALVIRLFSSRVPRLSDLRLSLQEMNTLQWYLHQENGMLLCTGPTGSGKTTTLYACLQALDDPRSSIVTIEHPVEKHFAPAKQIDVREETGDQSLTFASALRSVLRQDPDIIMIGEMRDSESAQIAVAAALTGHLVLSTVHANDSVGVIERLCGSFEIDRIALAYALKLVIAQRLVARLCHHCRRTRRARPEDLRAFPEVGIVDPLLSERVGCPACRGTGTQGRSVIMEMLAIDSEIISLIERRASPGEIREHNAQRGYLSLAHQATCLLLRGEIALSEAHRFLSRPVF